MAFKQPRVPEYRESEGVSRYIKPLILFLKDFTMSAWTANNMRKREIETLRSEMGGIEIPEVAYPVTSVNQKKGDVVLASADVGARSDTWMPTAAQVGALPEDGTAKDSEKLGGKTWEEMLFPVGSMFVTPTTESPAARFGGTWVLADKMFSPKTMTSGFFTFNTDNGTSTSSYAVRSGHYIRIRITVTPKVNFEDGNIHIGTFDFDALGIKSLVTAQMLVGISDGSNSLTMATVDAASGVLNNNDIVHKGGGTTLAAGSPVHYYVDLIVNMDRMLDSACNQFIWRRDA